MERAGATGLATIARDFTNQSGIPLIQVGPAQCVGGQTVTTITQSQFSNDERTEVAANPRRWHVPVRASAGGTVTQVVTSGPTAQVTASGCGPLLINPGQTGYFRTLYAPAQLQTLKGAFPKLGPVDQFGLMEDQMALAFAGYQPMAAGLDFVGEVTGDANAKVAQAAVRVWEDLYDNLDDDPAAQAAIGARASRVYGPRLQQLGFVPRAGEPVTDSLLRSTLINVLGKMRDPAVLSEAQRLFAAWQNDPKAIPGSLKQTWLQVVARNADAATWNALHAKAQAATGAVERTSLYQLLGTTRDETLARRALDLSLTKEPGSTVSAGMITTVADLHSRLAVDFMLAHLTQVNQLIDISGRSRFIQRLVGRSHDASLIGTLQSYASANLAATDRKPVEQAIDRLRFKSSTLPRVRSEVAAWLQAHPA
jgi:aminopeptidase N